MEIQIVRDHITRNALNEMARQWGAEIVKAVVDIERGVMAVGGEMHSDEETTLLDDGSKQADLWGINFVVAEEGDRWIEFDSMVNIRPWQGNRSRDVENQEVRKKIVATVNRLVQ